ncbi:hypothetical protein LTS08_001418 [Lithohypha guttulata]|nr:hypothetical protein LTS08_001418 [Lithohypha guttulata]
MSAITGDQYYDGWDAKSIIVVTTATVAVYNAFELLLMIPSRFKERRSLYFISLTIATLGVLPYFIGFVLEYFQLATYWLDMTVSTIGWICLITGQSFVLYSRLGLILNDARILRAVKWMIIIDAVVFHTSTTVVQYGKIANSDHRTAFDDALFYIEKIQMTGFCIQEFIISGLYLWKTIELLRVIQKKGTRKVMGELLSINIVIVIADVALLVLEYTGERVMERTWKGLVYSVKLKLEFAILSKLVDLVQSSQRTLSNALADVDTFVDISRTNTGASAAPLRQRRSEELPDWLAKLEDRHVQTLHLETVPSRGTAENSSPDPFITRKEV